MICPRRSSENVQIQIVQTGGKNAHKGVGLVCHSNNSARALTAVSMLGMSNLLWKKSQGTTRQKHQRPERPSFRHAVPTPRIAAQRQ